MTLRVTDNEMAMLRTLSKGHRDILDTRGCGNQGAGFKRTLNSLVRKKLLDHDYYLTELGKNQVRSK